jgi:hypothetical protein
MTMTNRSSLAMWVTEISEIGGDVSIMRGCAASFVKGGSQKQISPSHSLCPILINHFRCTGWCFLLIWFENYAAQKRLGGSSHKPLSPFRMISASQNPGGFPGMSIQWEFRRLSISEVHSRWLDDFKRGVVSRYHTLSR